MYVVIPKKVSFGDKALNSCSYQWAAVFVGPHFVWFETSRIIFLENLVRNDLKCSSRKMAGFRHEGLLSSYVEIAFYIRIFEAFDQIMKQPAAF